MNIVFWTIIFLLAVIHLLRHVVIKKEGGLIFWLSATFDGLIISSIVILFEHYYGDWPASEQVKLLVVVIAYAVVDQLFISMVSHLADHVEKDKVREAISTYGESRANDIVKARDEKLFKSLLDERLNTEGEAKVIALVNSRDAVEFNRLRQEQLNEFVQQDFEKRLQAAIEDGARADLAKSLYQEQLNLRQSGNDGALWVQLQGTNKSVAEALGVGIPQSDMVFAVPYWVYYDPTDKKPKAFRCNSNKAYLVNPEKVSFVSKRWGKVEGLNQIVLDGAVISRAV